MIHNDTEYQDAILRLREERERLAQQEAELTRMGLKPDERKRAMDPVRSFQADLDEEIALYERAKKRDFDEFINFEPLGRLLVYFRIAQGMSQTDLADAFGVHSSQVSRDERNEYHGITLERLKKLLRALGVNLWTRVELETAVQSTERLPESSRSFGSAGRWPIRFPADAFIMAASVKPPSRDQVVTSRKQKEAPHADA